ncbi:acyl-CoA dehydratase activase [Desulfonatronovibrio hydrogenovorans]|uniref:acyl-CoA dehydratase activase n=1 Tax=Desulfonatronovibrio hydrogenovorans TaxID=53245 RepID=UPI000491F552|nr:acyl-CoA dehydratase activase [Desulfonatronovibrio hydrogenovorans]
MKYDIGIDIGSVSINCAVLDSQGQVVSETPYKRHFGLILEETRSTLDEIFARFSPARVRSISFTGSQGQAISQLVDAPFEVETIAQVLGTTRVMPGVRTIIAIGGQDAALFQLEYNQDNEWYLEAFNLNSPCASGTGSFIDQQAERLAFAMYGNEFEMDQHKLQVVLQDFIKLGLESTYPAPVACRCTVFTKSDMIHLQNKGESLSNIIAGLHHGTAANYLSTIVSNRKLHEPIAFIGGMASNELQVRAFKNYYPELRVPPHHASLGAIGTALRSAKQNITNSIDPARLNPAGTRGGYTFPRARKLDLKLSRFDPDNSLQEFEPAGNGPVPAFLGIDIGSTSTKYCLIDDQHRIIHKQYVATKGKPIEVAQGLLQSLEKDLGHNIDLLAVATTGSGRNVVGDFIDADLIIDEITAHARGAVQVNRDIETIFEIGGQDSKYISIKDSHPVDFVMNKICAAGTGSFLHELANKMKINIVGQFQDIALSAEHPVNLAERCTVFMESDLVGYAQKGAHRDDLIAGLCFAIVRNYLHRVVENRPIGNKIMFLGGPSLNKGIVAAFERVTGKPIIVPRHREVMGAFGTALAVKELYQSGEITPRPRSLSGLADITVSFKESVCRADKNCHNECKLKIYRFGDRKSIWGGDCGRYESSAGKNQTTDNYFLERKKIFTSFLPKDAMVSPQDNLKPRPGKPVVGIPMALHFLEWGIFWTNILADLGFNIRLSPPTSQAIASAGVESMTAETCFPVKVFQGHVKHLLDNEVDYLFLPNPINIPTPEGMEQEKGLLCPMVESSQYMVKAALKIQDRMIIRPTVFLREGPEQVTDALLETLPPGFRPGQKKLLAITASAWDNQLKFKQMMASRGQDILDSLALDRPVWIVTGRPYNLYDERLNLRLGQQLAKLGIPALPMDFISQDEVDLSDFPRMYWGLGGRILRTARLVADNPNWFAVHMTNFSCGPDSFLEHFFEYILKHKPPLVLELDEHSAVAGMITRIEAYANVVRNIMKEHAQGIEA